MVHERDAEEEHEQRDELRPRVQPLEQAVHAMRCR